MPVGTGAAALLLVASTAIPLREIERILASRQIDPPPAMTRSTLSEAELEMLLSKHDPYARYLGPSAYRDFLSGRAERIGVGVHLAEFGGDWLIQPIPGGPAWRAGLTFDARLLRVDGQPVKGRERDWLVARMNGADQGPEVVLRVESLGGVERSFRIRRESFRAPSLTRLEEDGLSFIRLWDFRRRETSAGLRRALARLPDGKEPVVIDLRLATGGDLFEALDSASLFLPEGLSLGVIDDGRGLRREFYSLPGRVTHRPVLLLMSRDTASAAESFALALHHYGVALLVGERSHGKCLTQTLVPLSNGGAIRFSNGRLSGPAGSPCDPRGIEPDVAVDAAAYRSVAELVEAGRR